MCGNLCLLPKGEKKNDSEIVQATLQDVVTASDFMDEGEIHCVKCHLVVL